MVRILVVDDNPAVRHYLRSILEQQSTWQVCDEARTGGEALQRVKKDPPPDLILMDLNLPDVDGWEATRRLKEAPETRAIPIMAMTAHAIAGDQERALQAGCDDYHAKPVDFQRLLTQIEALLTKASRE